VAGLCLLIAGVLAACGDEPAAGVAPAGGASSAAPAPAPKVKKKLVPATALAGLVRDGRPRLEAERAKTDEAFVKNLRREVRQQGAFHRALLKLHKANGEEPFFFDEGELRHGTFPVLLAFIDALDAHAVDTEPYAREALLEAYSEHGAARDAELRAEEVLREHEDAIGGAFSVVRRWLLAPLPQAGAAGDAGDAPPATLPSDLDHRLASAGLSDGSYDTVAAAVDGLAALEEARAARLSATARLDARMLRAVMQAVLDFRLVKRVHPHLALEHVERAPDYYAERLVTWLLPEPVNRGEGQAPGGDDKGGEEKGKKAKKGKKGKKGKKKGEEKKKEPVPAPAYSGPPAREELAAFLAEQVPPFPLYARTVAALAHYRELAVKEKAAPPPVVARRGKELKKGAKGAKVVELKQRLAFEGYYPEKEEHDDIFGQPLEDALKSYQTNHQVDVTGRLDRITRSSLRRTMAFRAKQLGLSLQRYRESVLNEMRPDEFLRVNIPEFAVELWKDGELERKHRVIVGNNNWEEDHQKKAVGYLNRTQLFEAEVQSVVINPYWRVPKRIKVFELDEELMDEPDFYERHYYEVTTTPTGHEVVKQMPSDENALGRVKINFPNPHSIYMHDTPTKPLFMRTFRAYSHGCVRLHEALVFAQYLLERDGALDEEKFMEILDSFEEKSVRLGKPIPIVVEYNVTTVDDEGNAHFLADIYKYDDSAMKGEVPVVDAFELEAYREGKEVPYKRVLKARDP